MPFTDEAWETPEAELSAEDFCAVCAVDMNPSGQTKVKARCKLPLKKTPNGPYNRAAIRNAIARLPQTDLSPDAKRKAAKKLLRLAREGGIQVGIMLKRIAGE